MAGTRQTTAEQIRAYARSGMFTNREIAALTDTTLAYVKTAKSRARKPARILTLERSLSDLRERLRANEIRAARQDALIAKLLATVHTEGAVRAESDSRMLSIPPLVSTSVEGFGSFQQATNASSG